MRKKDNNKKIQIEQAVVTLVNELGYSNISMSKIAKKVGMSVSTLYVYYENQEEMFRSVFRDKKQQMFKYLENNINSDMQTKEMINQFCKNILQYVREEAEDFLFIEQSLDSPFVNGLPQELSEKFGKNIIEAFTKGVKDGVLKNNNVILLISFCVYPITQIYKEAINKDGMLNDINFHEIIEMCWDAVKK